MRTKWKEFQLGNRALHELESCRSSLPELKQYTVSLETGAGVLETNVPWAILRIWFRAANARMPHAHISEKASWEVNQ